MLHAVTCYDGPGPPRHWRRQPPGGWCAGRTRRATKTGGVDWHALAPQVDKICRSSVMPMPSRLASRKRARLFHSGLPARCCSKVVASLEAGNPPDIASIGPSLAALYRSQGHLLEVTDIVEKMQQVPGGLYEACLRDVMYKGKAYTVPQSVKSLGPGHPPGYPRGPPKSSPPRPGRSSSRSARSCRSRRGDWLWHVPGPAERYRQQRHETRSGATAASSSRPTTRRWPCTPRKR